MPARLTSVGSGSVPAEGKSRGAHRTLERHGTLVGFVVMIAAFWLLKSDVFGTFGNLRGILDQSSVIIVLAVGLTMVMRAGEFDLSFPGLIGLAAVIAVKAMANWGMSAAVAVVLALAVGIVGGTIAGVLVAAKRTSSFIATLALSAIWGGVALGVSGGGGSTITNIPDSYTTITFTRLFGLALPIYYALGVAIVVAVILRYTVFGRSVQAVGENSEAARLAGIRLSLTRVGAFSFMGICAGLSAVILSSRTAQYTPDIAQGLFIPPFVAAFFGVSVLAAGVFNVFGTLIGALFISTLETGLILLGTQSWVGDSVVGAALLTILFVSSRAKKTKE